MFTFGRSFSQPFVFAFKPAIAEPPRLASEWTLSSEHSLLMQVRRGDTLRVEHGELWIADDRGSDPLELREGATHTTARDAVWRLFGVDQPRVTVFSQTQVKVSVQADYGNWRYPPSIRRTSHRHDRSLFS